MNNIGLNFPGINIILKMGILQTFLIKYLYIPLQKTYLLTKLHNLE